MDLPARLRSARLAAKLSQAEAAKKLEVSGGTYGGWETGAHGIRLDRLPSVAKVLKTTIEFLVGGKAA